MKKANKTLVLAMGTTLITGLTSVAMASAAIDVNGNAFEMTELSSGYMQLAAADANTTAKPAAAPKTAEGKCAGAKPIATPKAAEGKCGEGQCGGAMKAAATGTATAKPAAPAPVKAPVTTVKPAATDAASKATEGKCGEGKCGGEMKKAAEASAAKK